MSSPIQRRRIGVVVIAGVLAGCSTLPKDHGPSAVRALVDARLGTTLAVDAAREPASDAQVRDWLQAPLTIDCALRVAWVRNPRIQVQYARLGLSRADVLEASRISNPTLAVSALRGDHVRESSFGISQSFADLILLPSRQRLASGELERAQREVASALVGLAADVETAWYRYAAATQVAQMRAAVSDAAAASAELAQRFHDAGNMTPLELALEQAAAASARIQMANATAQAIAARLALARVMGVAGEIGELPAPAPLAAPVPKEDPLDALVEQAHAQRLDLLAARQESAVRERAAGDARRFRLLGVFDLGVTRDRTEEGRHLTGPTLALGIPVFNQNQGPVARADALREESKAQVDLLTFAVENDVRTAVAQISAARETVEQYRSALLPLREMVVKRTQENVNYMFAGAFELILTRQQEFDAFQSYLEAVRDYWLARVDAQRAVGGRLPSDGAAGAPALDIETILSPPAKSMGHGHHHMPGMKHESPGDKKQEPPADSSGHDMSNVHHEGHSAPQPAQKSRAAKKAAPNSDPPAAEQSHDRHDRDSTNTDSGDTP